MVLLTELPYIDVEDVLREHINFSNSHVVVRTGDTAKAEDLEKVSVRDARTVLVMSPADHTREAAVARTRHVLLTMRSMKWSRYGTCVEEDQLPRNFLLFHETCYATSKVLVPGDFVGQLIVRSSERRGLSRIIALILASMEMSSTFNPSSVQEV